MCTRWLLLTVFGLGVLRPAPGTWGSLPAPLLALALVTLIDDDAIGHVAVNAMLLALGGAFSYACLSGGAWAEERWGSKDPGAVVADEVAGQSLTLLALPWQFAGPDAWRWNVALAATGFVAFRLFDIVKPPPARQLQRLPAGRGILVDDLFAGGYALIVTQVFARLVW